MALNDAFLIGYYKFDSTVNDSKNGYTGTATALTYSAGKIGNCAVFNGTTSTVSLGIPTNQIVGSVARTISFWIFGIPTGYIISIGPSVATQRFLIYNAGSGKIGVNTWEAQDLQTSSNPLVTAQWNHVVVVYSGSASLNSTSTQVWINGTQCTSNNPTTSTLNTQDTTYIVSPTDSYLTASVDELGLWARALNSTEIGQLYNGGAGLTYPFGTSTTNPAFFLNFI